MLARTERAAFGAMLRTLRKSRGIGLRRLACEVRVDQGHLSRVERGVVPASEHIIRRVAGALGADPEALLVASGRLPPDINGYLVSDPVRVVAVLREAFSRYDSSSSQSSRMRPSTSSIQGGAVCRPDGR